MTSPTTAELRAWARAQGMDVGDRGRLSPQVRQAWDAAHAGEPVATPSTRVASKRAPRRTASPAAPPAPAEPDTPPAEAAEQDREAERRFADLERQVGELARRVAQLERAAETTPRRRRFGRRE